MKNYENYTVEEFADDPSFRSWVLHPDSTETPFWESWIAVHPEKIETIQSAKELVRMLRFRRKETPESFIKEDWKRLHTEIGHARPLPNKVRKLHIPVYMRWVAGFAFLLMIGAWASYTSWKTEADTHIYQTAYGETQEIELPDGSQVTLNANSQIQYASDWVAGQPRDIHLDGEAYFDVRHLENPELSPFRVHTGKMTVQVLGTQFNVTDREGDTRVVLNSGKVQLSDNRLGDTLTMQPGEMVELSTDKHAFVKQVVNPEIYSSWTENRWIFDGTTISVIARRIENTYGISVNVEGDRLRNRELSGSLKVESLDFLLSALSTSFEINIHRDGDKITMREGPIVD